MSVALQFKLTQVGQAAVWNATNTGMSLNLTHIQFGSGRRAPSGTELALVQPKQAAPIAAGFSVSPTQIRMSAIFGGALNYMIAEVGLWAGDPAVAGSKLIGYWSQDSADLAAKSAGVDFIFSHDMKLDAAVPAGSLTIQADGAQSAMLAMIMAHEAKSDPHPQYSKRLTAGAALPTSDIGTIWHDDYGGFMTWQVFNANGATYTGYASVTVGSLVFETQPTPRKGYIKSGVSNLSRTAYAALRGWAMHNGVMVASASWAAGSFIFKDNADGTTFTVADVRGEFPRFWDDGRGVDSGRNFGSSQAQDIQQHTHSYSKYGTLVAAQAGGSFVVWAGASGVETVSSGSFNGIETRPRNTALLAAIKY